jgi:subtilase family serine protease
MASAICPKCNILLVEADDAYLTSLGAAVQTAARLGATVISNSYGGSDLPDSSYGQAYNHPGIPITASTGDNGYGVSFPASSAYVTAVGGTSLRSSTTAGRGWTETAWSGAGSGCSRYNAKPSWQTATTGCANRAVADVSAVADPYTGVQVYDTFASSTSGSGWMVFGGTSASAPIIAAVYALAGNAAAVGYPYSHAAGNLYDVVSGSNGRCRPSVLCTSAGGWDGPTGLGTPNGIGAF